MLQFIKKLYITIALRYNPTNIKEYMLYKENYFHLCKVPLDAQSEKDVEVLKRADKNEEFPSLFSDYEELRSEAFNEDGIYSIVRAKEIYLLIRTNTRKQAQIDAYEEAESEIITTLKHRVVQEDDESAKKILKNAHDIEID